MGRGPFKKKKSYTPRRQREREHNHWLSEGADGQDSLLLELDPYLYCLDQTISTIAASIWHKYEGEATNPFGMLVQSEGSVGWHIGYLSQKYNLYVHCEELDPVIEQAAERFGLQLISMENEHELLHGIEFFLYTRTLWTDTSSFSKAVHRAIDLRAPDGTICFALAAEGTRERPVLRWQDGSTNELHEICRDIELFAAEPPETFVIPLAETDPFEGLALSAFLKRNRDFFGRDVRDLLVRRMHEADFLDMFSREDGRSRCAVLLVAD